MRSIVMVHLLFAFAFADDIQDKNKQETLITIGIGTGYFGPTSYYGISNIRNSNLIAFRYLNGDEFQFNVAGSGKTPSKGFNELAFLYGRTLRKDLLELSLMGGISFVEGIDRGSLLQDRSYRTVDISTIGFPFESRFRFDFGLVNIGGSWYGNLNHQKSYSGAMLELSIKLFGY